MKARYMIYAALIFSSLVVLAGRSDTIEPLVRSDDVVQTYRFEIPIRSEVVPLRSILIHSRLNENEVAQIESALNDKEVSYVPEALVILTAEGFSDEDGDGVIVFDLVDQTGDDIRRSVSVSAKAVQDRRLLRAFAQIDRFKPIEAQFENMSHPVIFELWKYSYSDYAVDRSIAHGRAGLTFPDGSALNFSETFEIFGYATTQFEGQTQFYPVSGRSVRGHLELSSTANWSEFIQASQSLKDLADWDEQHVLPKFERWSQARRNEDETKEALDALVQETIDLKKSEERSLLADRVRQNFLTADQINSRKAELPSGKTIEWTVDLHQSGQPVSGEIQPKLYSYSNSSNDAQPRAHFMHWIEVPGVQGPNGEIAIAGLFSEYIKDRSNRTFVCEGAPVDELHQSVVGAASPQQFAFIQPDYYEGALDAVKVFSLNRNEVEPGFAFNILYWYIFRDETHGKSFIDLDRSLSTPTIFEDSEGRGSR